MSESTKAKEKINKESQIESKDINTKCGVNSDNNSNKYQCSKFILEYTYKEVCRESERVKTLESRIPILITVATFFGSLILSKDNFGFTDMLKSGDKKIVIFIGLQTICYLFLIVSIGIFTFLLLSVKYKSIDIMHFSDINAQSADEGLAAFDILKRYLLCYEENKKKNTKKLIISNIGIISLAISSCTYFLMQILKLF